MRRPIEILAERLLARSAVNEATVVLNGVHCREWQWARHDQGYGQMWDGERTRYTHRLAYEAFVGPIPDGLDVCHRCDNPRCIEPAHLWCGTHQENMADRDAKGRHREKMIEVGLRRRGTAAPWLHGSRHPRAKLEADEVRTIWRRLQAPRVGRKDRPSALAREFGVSEGLIRRIRDGASWGWLTRMM